MTRLRLAAWVAVSAFILWPAVLGLVIYVFAG